MVRLTKTRPNKPDMTKDGRAIVRSDSRPREATTVFTTRGDSLNGIGDGQIMQWDFSNSDNDSLDETTTPIPSGYKRKRIEVGFSDTVHIKEGAMYFFNAPKGCYLDFYVVCKAGGYYVDPNGSIPASALGIESDDYYTQAISDTPILHYVNHHFLQGNTPMGDELNTEGASEDGIPPQQSGYVIWIEITTPTTDIVSNGSAEIELYRNRTLLLPGESV